MSLALKLQNYLDATGVPYDVVTHEQTGSSSLTAEASHVSAANLAKGVVIKHKGGYLLAVLPAARQIRLDTLGGWLNVPVCLATEEEASALFPDCGRGAIPPLPNAYGLAGVIDDSLEGPLDVYCEGGDHCTLVHLSGEAFQRLMGQVPHQRFCA